jgi:hypothetical protein
MTTTANSQNLLIEITIHLQGPLKRLSLIIKAISPPKSFILVFPYISPNES